jgi:hypothetical protein
LWTHHVCVKHVRKILSYQKRKCLRIIDNAHGVVVKSGNIKIQNNNLINYNVWQLPEGGEFGTQNYQLKIK